MKQNKMNKKPQTNTAPKSPAAKAANLRGVPAPKPAPKPKLPKGMEHDMKLLKAVFAIQNPSNNKACNDHAMSIITGLAPDGCTVVRNKGNLLIRKGAATGPHPHYLAHMDQVHDYVPFMSLEVQGNVLAAFDGNDKQTGVGGDDKSGIYLALMMLHHLDHCTAVFVRDEEVGCQGSGVVPLEWFAHAAFVIQADRNNRTMDIIRSTNGMTCSSDGFFDAMLGLPICTAAKHSEAHGSVTDIGELASRGLHVSMVNISSGYHDPHSSRETVHMDELSIMLEVGRQAAALLGDQRWDHVPEDEYAQYRGYGKRSSYPSYGKPSYTGLEDEWTTGSGYMDINLDTDTVDIDAEREEIIHLLVTDHGFDREFDGLDQLDTADLDDMLFEYEEAAHMDDENTLAYTEDGIR